jgi:hypothetical protein
MTKLELSADEKVWVDRKWKKIRISQAKADKAGNDWNRLNDEINDLMDRQGVTDIVQRSKTKSASLPLKDALDVGKWHAAESQRHIDDLALFLQMRQLGVL